MTANPYVRPRLAATRAGIPQPVLIVENWLDQLDTELAAPVGEDAFAAYDLLAGWLKLQRVRPELLAECGGEKLLPAANELITRRGPELARLALQIPNPGAWREEAQKLNDSYEEDWDPTERAQFAERVLSDLDDAELVCLATARIGVPDTALQRELDRCREWCFKSADAFLAASVQVQAVGVSFFPDLLERDAELALTALKYEAVLNAAEEAEGALELQAVMPLPASVVRPLWERFHAERTAVAVEVQKFLIVAAALVQHVRQRAMGRAEIESEPEFCSWEWAGPQGSHARLTVPLDPKEGEAAQVGLVIVGPDRLPATHLAGPVILNSIASVIDETGKAVFQLLPLLEGDRTLSLFVGADNIEWKLVATL